MRQPAKVAAAKKKTKKKAKAVTFEEDDEEAEPNDPSSNTCFEKCVFCDEAVCDDPLGAKYVLCRGHLRDLHRREQRLQKWSMQWYGEANALHALTLPDAHEWLRDFCLDFQRLHVLIDYLIDNGEDPCEPGGLYEESPLEHAISGFNDAMRIKARSELGIKLDEDQKRQADACFGIGNVAIILASHWKDGRGDVMPEVEEQCDLLVTLYNERVSGKCANCESLEAMKQYALKNDAGGDEDESDSEDDKVE